VFSRSPYSKTRLSKPLCSPDLHIPNPDFPPRI
jgi:hypothetical protein